MSAIFSPCRTYRYALWRIWEPGPVALFIGLNPSTADETNNDPTIRRCISFAKRWHFAGLVMANLFAFCATNPRAMRAAVDPVGPGNDAWLRALAGISKLSIAAWGAHGMHRGRDQEVRALLGSLYCLGTTETGQPRHPLYLRSDCQLQLWQVAA